MHAKDLVIDGRHMEGAWWGPSPDVAPTLVLLHEGLGCVELWRDFPERLQAATGCGVFAYSRFGYGRSDSVTLPRPMTYMHEAALKILPKVLDQIGVRQAITVGHSDGGSIAAIHAGGTRDKRLTGVVMMAAHFFVEELNIASIAQIKTAYETTDLRTKMARYHDDVDGAFHGWNGAWLDPRFRAFDIVRYLEAIQVPILGLQGEDDPYGSDAQLQVLQRHVGVPAEIWEIPDARHSPHLEAKDDTIATIVAFIKNRLQEANR